MNFLKFIFLLLFISLTCFVLSHKTNLQIKKYYHYDTVYLITPWLFISSNKLSIPKLLSLKEAIVTSFEGCKFSSIACTLSGKCLEVLLSILILRASSLRWLSTFFLVTSNVELLADYCPVVVTVKVFISICF